MNTYYSFTGAPIEPIETMHVRKFRLKSCPFCGKSAEMKVEKHAPKGYDYTPRCIDPACAGRLTKKWTNQLRAVESWNMREAPENTADEEIDRETRDAAILSIIDEISTLVNKLEETVEG